MIESWSEEEAIKHVRRTLDYSQLQQDSPDFLNRRAVKTLFPRIESVHFPVPVQSREKLSVLNSLKKEALDSTFIQQIGHLKRKISKFLRPKQLLEKTLDGISFLLVVEEYLRIFNKGETLTLSGIVQRTEAEERKFLMNHIQDWIHYYFEVNFLRKDLVERGVLQLIEMASEDHPDFQFEVFKKSFEYFCQELRTKEEREKSIRLKLLAKSVENINSAWPELEGQELLRKMLEDESLQGKLFGFDEILETVLEAALSQDKLKTQAQVEFMKEKMQMQDTNYVYMKEQYEQLERENMNWKKQLNNLEEEYQIIRVKLTAQKEELSNLRKINSGESNSNVQFEILIQKNAELNQENSMLKDQLEDSRLLTTGADLTDLLDQLKSSKRGGDSRAMVAHIKQTLLQENEGLRKRVAELVEREKQLEDVARRGSFKKVQLNQK